jgi:methionyl-tRNA synthetase
MFRMSRILAAVAWPYANGPRHIGHVAGFGVPSDVFSRYMRMRGHDVLMISGTDEHGTPILVQAEAENTAPQDLADRYNRMIVEDLAALGLSYDLFTRTTTRNHYAVAQELFRTVYRNGYLIPKTMQGAISPSTGRTLPDRFIEGTCPICSDPHARGDQCDNCGNQLDPIDLLNPRSRINQEVPEFRQTEHYFLDLPAVATELTQWLNGKVAEGSWRPNVLKFSLNLLEDIRPRAMTRDIDWGIPVPLPGWEDQPTKRLYVWFDAVIGYLSASIEWARRSGDDQAWRNWWNDPQLRSYYFMGKDNITFHSQIWPAELIAYNNTAEGAQPGEYGELQLPTEVVSSEFLTMEGKKFASSRGVVIYVRDVLERYQPDALRYFISAAGPENQDTDFTWAEFVRRTNDELVAGWGNLVNRTANLLHKNFGEIPQPGNFTEADQELLAAVEMAFDTVGGLIENHRQKQALAEAMRVVSLVNAYLADQAPWKLKEDLGRMGTVLFTAAQAIRDLGTMLSPFLPFSAQVVHETLGGTGIVAPMPKIVEVRDLDDPERGYPILTGDYTNFPSWGRADLIPGTPVAAPTPIFTKLDPSVIEEELARLQQP